jgi:asparagine synthase (glutamine-hydrolysing)
MCGIFGYIAKEPFNDKAILTALSRRGPDGQGSITLPWRGKSGNLRCTLLHTRLAIIDLSPSANQPMTDQSGNYTIILNGEIYNYRDLKAELKTLGHQFSTESDTEVLLHGYMQWKENVLNKLRGMFAFCICDKVEMKLFIARDHFGQKPLYYFEAGEAFCFSSTISALLASGIRKKFALSLDAINHYLGFGSFVSPDTILEEVKSLPPGHYLTYQGDTVMTTKYYHLEREIESVRESRASVLERLRMLMVDVVEKHLIADVPVGVFLSGGIDSSVIAGIASKVSQERIHTFSVGFQEDLLGEDETAVATRTAQKLGSVHENIRLGRSDFSACLDEFVSAIDLPSVDGLNTYFISKAIGTRVKVILSGLGGDEMFAGYPVFHQVFALKNQTALDRALSVLPRKVLNRIRKSHLQFTGLPLFDVLVTKRAAGTVADRARENLRRFFCESEEVLKTVSIFEISHYMASTLLRDTDAVSMYHSLETRVPFVDKEVFAFVMSVPDDYKIQNGLNKPLLVEAFSGLLVEDTYRLPKRGFTLPIDTWVRSYLSEENSNVLREFANQYNVSPDACPLTRNALGYSRKDSNERYKWLILLKWIEKHQHQLSASAS